MVGKIVFAFLAGSIFGLTVWGFFVGAKVWEEGKRTGAFLQERKMNRTLVDIGNPEIPSCYIQVPLNNVNELAQAGVFQWVYACLEEHSQ